MHFSHLPPTQPMTNLQHQGVRPGKSFGQQLFTMAMKPKPVMLPKRPTESPMATVRRWPRPGPRKIHGPKWIPPRKINGWNLRIRGTPGKGKIIWTNFIIFRFCVNLRRCKSHMWQLCSIIHVANWNNELVVELPPEKYAKPSKWVKIFPKHSGGKWKIFELPAPVSIISYQDFGVSKNRGTPKWMAKIMENPIKMDDLGVPLFSETSISKWKSQTVPWNTLPTFWGHCRTIFMVVTGGHKFYVSRCEKTRLDYFGRSPLCIHPRRLT